MSHKNLQNVLLSNYRELNIVRVAKGLSRNITDIDLWRLLYKRLSK